MDSEKTPIWQEKSESGGGNVGATGGSSSESGALFHDSTQSPKAVSHLGH